MKRLLRRSTTIFICEEVFEVQEAHRGEWTEGKEMFSMSSPSSGQAAKYAACKSIPFSFLIHPTFACHLVEFRQASHTLKGTVRFFL